MSKFTQNLSGEKVTPGGPFLYQLLFRDKVEEVNKKKALSIIEKHIKNVDLIDSKKGHLFVCKDYMAKLKDSEVPVSLSILPPSEFNESKISEFIRSQMWDVMDVKEKILSQCKYNVVAFDMLGGAIEDINRRPDLNMSFLDALLEMYEDCVAVFFPNSGKLFIREQIEEFKFDNAHRYIKFGVNIRFFRISNNDDYIVDSIGMASLFLPDVQYHFHNYDINLIVNHAYNLCQYLFDTKCSIQSGDTIDSIDENGMNRDIQWTCQYESSLVQPKRDVLDVNITNYASGNRD